MVAFSYTRTASSQDIKDSLDQALGVDSPKSQIEADQQNNNLIELSRQVSQSSTVLGGDATVYRRQIDDRVAENTVQVAALNNAQQQLDIIAANETADRDIDNDSAVYGDFPDRQLTSTELERFRQGQDVFDEDNVPVAINVSGSNDDEYSENAASGEVVRIDVSGSNEPIPNPLHEFATYTYGISLHYMTIKDYNAFVASGQFSTKKNRTIIASGGRRNSTMARNENFNLDMYIGDFKMVTLIGANPATKGSNAVTIEFTIYEPIGATFIERLVALARENDIQNWIEMPLVLQIDFFAQTDTGEYIQSPIPNLTKFLCVKLTDLKLEITNKGAEYKCLAIPHSHQALSKNSVVVPVNFEITAKSVGEFFASTSSVIGIEVSENRAQPGSSTQRPNIYKSLSLADALNEYQKVLAKPTQGKKYQDTADEYFFVIDREIADSKIFVPDKHNLSTAPMQNDVIKKDVIDKERGAIPINAGTNLIEVINQIIRSSEFYRKQIQSEKNAESEPSSNRPVNLHKVTTKIEYSDEWDSIRKQYRKKITYFINRYPFHNHVYSNAPKSVPTRTYKRYDYIYTGKNQDIRDFKIEFNTLWFTALTSFENRFEKDNLNIVDDPLAYSEGIDLSAARAQAVSKKKTTKNEVFPLRTFNTSVNPANQQISDGSKKSVQAVDFWNSIFNYKGGDMVTLTLEIAGDPDFIKQDDVWYPGTLLRDNNVQEGLLDRAEVYIDVRFRLPDDLDLTTGLYLADVDNSAFAGVYGVTTVENIFKDGAFFQRLQCYRLFGQEEKQVGVNRPNREEAGSRTSSDSEGLGESSTDYEEELNQAGLRAYEERNSQTNSDTASQDQEDAEPESYGEWRDWGTTDAVDAEDLPGG